LAFLIFLRCHFQRICPFFFQRLELLFIISPKNKPAVYKDFAGFASIKTAAAQVNTLPKLYLVSKQNFINLRTLLKLKRGK